MGNEIMFSWGAMAKELSFQVFYCGFKGCLKPLGNTLEERKKGGGLFNKV